MRAPKLGARIQIISDGLFKGCSKLPCRLAVKANDILDTRDVSDEQSG
ncbi:hypothetical protein [Pseudomonas sp. GM21]|nr:hypothetical protein [Pseudomonas sp. GM21]